MISKMVKAGIKFIQQSLDTISSSTEIKSLLSILTGSAS